MAKKVNGNGENGNRSDKTRPTLLEILSNPLIKVCAFDPGSNEVYHMSDRGVIGELTGMTNAGKDKHLDRATKLIAEDEELVDLLGRPPRLGIFKPNEVVKRLYVKGPETRAIFDRIINRSTSNLLESLVYMELRGDTIFTPVELDLALINRGPYDNLRFTRTLYDYGLLSREQMERNSAIAQEVLRHIGFVISFNIPVEEAMRRENEEEGEVMNEGFLRMLHHHYGFQSEEVRQYGKPFGFGEVRYEEIDGTEDVNKNSGRFMAILREEVKTAVERKAYKGTGKVAEYV